MNWRVAATPTIKFDLESSHALVLLFVKSLAVTHVFQILSKQLLSTQPLSLLPLTLPLLFLRSLFPRSLFTLSKIQNQPILRFKDVLRIPIGTDPTILSPKRDMAILHQDSPLIPSRLRTRLIKNLSPKNTSP